VDVDVEVDVDECIISDMVSRCLVLDIDIVIIMNIFVK